MGVNRKKVTFPCGLQGPFRIEFRGINSCDASEKCGNPQKMALKNLKVTKDANNQWRYLYNMDVNLSVPIDDNYKVRAET